MKIAIIGFKKQEQFAHGVSSDENADLIAFLNEKGLDVVFEIWNDDKVDWKSFNLVILKSPWDYHNHLADFLDWLDYLEGLGVKVLNSVETIKWNSHKKYLKDFEHMGLPVIRSEFLLKGDLVEETLFDHLDSDKLVLKPCVSAGAQNTIIIYRDNYAHAVEQINALIHDSDFIVQPFVEQITEGEWSFLFFNGKYSHCVLKTPKSGDFRVQHYHGGSISYPDPDPMHIAQARSYVDHLQEMPLYARVDGVLINGTFRLMELELIEPYLFLDGKSSLLNNYYKALLAQISSEV